LQWFLKVSCDNTTKNPYVTDNVDLKGFDEWDFCKGVPVDNWDNGVWFQAKKVHNDGDPDDVLQNLLGLPIYSKRLQLALIQEGINRIQYLPVKILRPDNSEIDGFAIANILDLIPSLDWERSNYELKKNRPGEVRYITNMVLKRQSIQGYDIFRMKEFKLNIIVSEKFKTVFEKNRFTGYSFDKRRLS
jgi:hypothetical protein